MQAHGLRVASGQHQGCALALLGADRPEDVDRTRPLIMRGAGPGAPSGPAPGNLVLLAHTGLVLPPQLDRGALREARPDRLQGGGETFLKSSSASGFWATAWNLDEWLGGPGSCGETDGVFACRLRIRHGARPCPPAPATPTPLRPTSARSVPARTCLATACACS